MIVPEEARTSTVRVRRRALEPIGGFAGYSLLIDVESLHVYTAVAKGRLHSERDRGVFIFFIITGLRANIALYNTTLVSLVVL